MVLDMDAMSGTIAVSPVLSDGQPPSDSRQKQGESALLDKLNFFLADVRDGLGPYLAVYLLSASGRDGRWDESSVGLVLTISGVVGLVAQTPAGALVDRSRNKPRLLAVAILLVTLSTLLLPFMSGLPLVTLTQSMAAVAGAIFAPVIAAMTLGLVGTDGFARRIGRNESFNHLGNAVSAAIAGLLAWHYGPVVVFWLMGLLAIAGLVTVLRIDNRHIDNDLANGGEANGMDGAALKDQASPGLWRILADHPGLMTFAVLVFLFHLANAAMLTSVSQLLMREVGKDMATSLAAACIVAAQMVMVPVAMLVGRFVDRIGTRPIFLLAFGILALRGMLYPLSGNPWWLLGVQLLDGVGAGIFGALFPVVVADLTKGTGRFNISQGAVATAQGIGAALSAGVAGLIIVKAGYSVAFFSLAGVAGLGFVLYALLMPETRHL
ncbi:Permease [Granulibacter bethesdensis]|uniref:Permease n=2 Tax=Granulibacter bethesdensis TaxID=364410 RepID=Q0BQ56_GRABC|nr:Permease [Granulibacter bethesdensis CGDNIH1]AHJ67988.1 Permease [Granulibacter bethesdensis]APH52920.1 Permease [Granulibacter bethesdensis]APH65608.1 Permease [Granulibacter bethesdensis]